MFFRCLSLRRVVIASFVIFSCAIYLPSLAYDLEIFVGNATAHVGEQNVIIPVYMRNWTDSIAGFELTLQTNHSDMTQFAGVDTSGTLVSGWEMIRTPFVGDMINILAIANLIPPPVTPGIGYPQTGEIPLINLLVNFDMPPDTMSVNYIYVTIRSGIHEFNFSDESGNSIGINYGDPIIDTSYYNCLEWDMDIDTFCLEWEEVPYPPADSMHVDTILNPYLDTSIVSIQGGFVYLIPDCDLMGDPNCSGDLNLLDITFLIDYLYRNSTVSSCIIQGDVNCDCVINLLDIICLISHLYKNGVCSPCPCSQWEDNCWNL